MFHQLPGPQPGLQTSALHLGEVSHPFWALSLQCLAGGGIWPVRDDSSLPWPKEPRGGEAAQTGPSPAVYFLGMFLLVDTDSDLQVLARLPS